MNPVKFWSQVDKSSGTVYGGESCWVWTKSVTPYGYGQFYGGHAHTYSWTLEHGPIEPGMKVDHMCHNPPCVNPVHLRLVTHAVNIQNQGTSRSNTSGYRGVSWFAPAGMWRAYASKAGRQYSFGYFKEVEDANLAAIAGREELYGEGVITTGGAS